MKIGIKIQFPLQATDHCKICFLLVPRDILLCLRLRNLMTDGKVQIEARHN